MANPLSSELQDLPSDLALAFAPLHKRAFGMAIGIALGSCVFLATIYSVVVPGDSPPLFLLGNYFPGYTVSLPGAFVGFGWAFFTFFVAGWFWAFCRNFVIAASVWVARTRAELKGARDFLDHI